MNRLLSAGNIALSTARRLELQADDNLHRRWLQQNEKEINAKFKSGEYETVDMASKSDRGHDLVQRYG